MGNKKKKYAGNSARKNRRKFNKNSMVGRVSIAEFQENLNFKWVFSGLVIAFLFYWFCFSAMNANFVLVLGMGSILLALCAVWAGGGLPLFWHNIGNTNIWVGVGSSVVLYIIFVILSFFMQSNFAFVSAEMSAIYALVEGHGSFLLGGTLLIIAGPCLELFWRGLVQGWAEKVMGRLGAVFFTTLCYTAVFALTMNKTLMLTALVCGLYWGFLYFWRRSLAACVFSHSLWLLAILVIYPLVIL